MPEHLAATSSQENVTGCISAAAFWPPQNVMDSAWLEHGPFAFWLIEAIRPSILVELGTHNGFSYFSFCQATQWLGLSTACYAVDTWLGDEHAGFYGEEVYAQVAALNNRQYSGFSRLLRCRFDEALPYFEDSTVDLLHIDGRHHYEDVLTDFATWRPKLSTRGIVLFHDLNVREREFGVWRLWSELAAQHPSFSFVHGHGLGVLAAGADVPAGLRPLFEARPDQVDMIRAAYARLGVAVRRQYELDTAHRSLGEAAVAQARLRAEHQVAVAEQDRLQLEQQAAVAEQDRLQLERQAAVAERDKYKRASEHADASVAALNVQVRDLEIAQAGLSALLDRHRAAADEQVRTVATLHNALEREVEAAHAAQVRALQIEQSTFWRATRHLRAILTRTPTPVRRALRRGAKVLWWAATPHRMPERIAFLRSRRQHRALQDQEVERTQEEPEAKFVELWPDSQDVIRDSTLEWFDPEYYLNQEPKLEDVSVDPLTHYSTVGWRQGRNPHPLFEVSWYLKQEPSVADSHVDPLQHFLSQLQSAESGIGAPRGWARSARDFGDVPTQMPVPYTPPGRARFDETRDEVVFDHLKSADILSLDIFDTALIRRVAHPTTVFDMVADAARTINPRLKSYADLRFWAEREARNIAVQSGGTPEISLKHIYDLLSKELNLTESEQEHLERLELDVERRVLCANPKVLGWYQKAIAAGKRTVFVSDMYLPSAFLKEVLSAEGYENPVVFVSNEYGVGKWQVSFYELIAAKLGMSGKRIVHLGDNPQADKECAEAAGWNAIHYADSEAERPFALQMADVSGLDISNTALSVALGLSRVHRARTEAVDLEPFERIARHIGYEVVGPTILAFAGWIAARAKVDRLDRVLFLARDGFLTQQVYEELRKAGLPICESRYVLASRRLLYSQRFRNVDDVKEAIRYVHFSMDTTLAEYLDIFSFSDEDITFCAGKLGVTDLNAPLLPQLSGKRDYPEAKHKIDQVLASLAPTIVIKARESSNTLKQYYMHASGYGGCGRLGIVDFGWAGSIMAPLYNIFQSISPETKLASYFFGLLEERKDNIPTGMEVSAYFFCDVPLPPIALNVVPSPRRYQDVMWASVPLIEILIGQNTTTAIGLQFDPLTSELRVTRADDAYSAEQRQVLAAVHEEAMRFARDAIQLLGATPGRWDLKPLLAHAWNRILSSPNADEARLFATFPHRADASGRAANTRLVAPRSNSEAPLGDELRAAQWPAAGFALLNPIARARLLDDLSAAERLGHTS
jgi:FMN phosphatase YigB (HAD superfamily)